MHADIREYIDTADLHALIAPRLLIVQTGMQDTTYSSFTLALEYEQTQKQR